MFLFSSIFNSTFSIYLSSLDEKMFKPFSILQWLDLRWPGAASMGTCALRGTYVSCADECLSEADSMCVISNKPPA